MELEGKVAVILGASAAGGTGWAIAEALAAEGAKVVVAARRRKPLQALAQKIGGTAFVCDAGNPEDLASLARSVVNLHGGLDIAVNSAARPVVGLIADTSLTDLQRSLDVNFLGQVNFVREIGAIMRDNGSIVLISSASATQPTPPFFPYACAKAATDCLVRYAALEFGPRGIRVNSILPGPIKTEMVAHIFADPAVEDVFNKNIPLGRIGNPEDFAKIAVVLSGSHYISGVNIPVSGGLHLTRIPRQDELPISDVYDKNAQTD